MMKKLTFASVTVGLLSTMLMLNAQQVSAESFQTKDVPTVNTKYKIIKRISDQPESNLKIELSKEKRQIKVGEKIEDAYFLEGVTATDSIEGNLTDKVTYTIATPEKSVLKTIKKIDTSKPAEYTVTYAVTNKEGMTVTETSTLAVTDETSESVDKKPEITIQDMDKVVEAGQKIDEAFILEGVKATDLDDGDLTSKLSYTLALSEADKLKSTKKIDTTKPGTYTVTYAVKNKAGLSSTLSSTIEVAEKVEALESNKLEIAMAYVLKTVTVGETIDEAFILNGLTATDTIDGDLTTKITYKAVFTENTPKATNVTATKLDTSKVGTYTLTYTVENSLGKTASIEGQIEVLEKASTVKDELAINIQDIGKILNKGDKADKEYIMNGVSATDPTEGDLTAKITYKLSFVEEGSTEKVEKDTLDTSKAGLYTITYTVENSVGKTASIEGQIRILDKPILPVPVPTISIKNANKTVKVGDVIDEAYIMNGVTARDETDGDLTSKIMYTVSFSEITVAASAASDKLDTSEPGVYTITYVVKNAAGGIATADGTITVTKDTTSSSSTSSIEKPTGKTTEKPSGKLPSTGEKNSNIALTFLGLLALLAVYFTKKKIKA